MRHFLSLARQQLLRSTVRYRVPMTVTGKRAMSYVAANADIDAVATSAKYRDAQADLRSDTVTMPTDAMFAAMASATRGDDVLGDDASIKQLEQDVASMLGHEAGLFCVSGTMTNQLALRTLLIQPPHSVLCDDRSHVYMWEAGGIAFHCQANVSPVHASTPSRMLTLQEVKANLVHDDVHAAPTRVVSLENTLGGTIFPYDDLVQISQFCREKGIKLHLDGARLWNAATVTGIPLGDYGKLFDTVSVCFSKGLGAPIGSCLVGSTAIVKKARHFRKLYGGGWRQAGMLAGAVQHCLKTVYPDSLIYSHRLAATLAASLQELGVKIKNAPVDTNILFVDVSPLSLTAQQIAVECGKLGIRVRAAPPPSAELRLVMHYQLSESVVQDVVDVVRRLAQSSTSPAKKQRTE
ncbi:Threonine aldolase [Sorochytrium milnesiophthora]